MRKLIFAINMTADGYCDHTLGIPDDSVLEYFTGIMRESGTLLYGRKTYELMFPYWPEIARTGSGGSKAENEFAQAFVAVPQLAVVSKTLKQVEGAEARIIRGNLKEEILKLKSEPGKNISTGGIDLPSELLELGLIDEVRLLVHPVLAGGGRRLFSEASFKEQIPLKLAGTRVFSSGWVALHYERVSQ